MKVKLELNTWREKVLDGYLYKLGKQDRMVIITNSQGVINYGTKLEKAEIPDILIQQSIYITMDEGLFNTTEFHPLSEVTWYKNEEND